MPGPRYGQACAPEFPIATSGARYESRVERNNSLRSESGYFRNEPENCTPSGALTHEYMQLPANDPKQILVVEDEGLIAADLQNRLRHLGYSVPAIAHSAAEALQCVKSMRFDLVLMDIHLKGATDGIEA